MGEMKLEDMPYEELISYRDDLLEFMRKDNSSDCRIFRDVHAELINRLDEGEKAIKEVARLTKEIQQVQ